MTRKHTLLCWVLLALLLAGGCRRTRTGPPEVIRYPTPAMPANQDLYNQADCSDEFYYRSCSANSPLGKLGCRQIFRAPDVFNGLKPLTPILICRAFAPPGEHLTHEEYIFNPGCDNPLYLRYVILQEGHYQLLSNIADLQAAFAPIESPAEALSYAVAATGYLPFFDHEPDPTFRYFVDSIEETHVEKIPQGYRVHLMDDHFCGCGPHTVYGVDVIVTQAGKIKTGLPKALFQDSRLDETCYE